MSDSDAAGGDARKEAFEAYFQTAQGRAELEAYFRTPEGGKALKRAMMDEIYGRQPTLARAVKGDAAVYTQAIFERQPRSGLGFLLDLLMLSIDSEAFFALLLYRVRTSLQVRHVPLLPSVLHHMSMMIAQICIGKGVIIQPGISILHGQVVIDGKVEVGSHCTIAPWVTLGRNGPALEGPTIGANTFIGTGAKLLGPIKIGDHVRIGANAVVITDIESYATAAGMPAKVVRSRKNDPEEQAMRDAVRLELEKTRAEDPTT